MQITKMQGIGNSYVLIEDLDRKLEKKYPKIAKAISDKSFGIGSDGILVVNKGKKAKFWMRVINPDGSEAEMCGNGIRIFARYLYDKKLIGKESDIEVGGSRGGRIVKPRINDDGTITVDMGKGKVLEKKVIVADGKKFSGICVSVGNPHFVIFTKSEKEAKENAANYGSAIENHSAFSNKTNVEFAFVKTSDEIIVHVWERGAGLTLACGTGASATAFAALKGGRTKNKTRIILPGGELAIEVKNDDTVMMSGPAEYIFSSTIDIDKLLSDSYVVGNSRTS